MPAVVFHAAAGLLSRGVLNARQRASLSQLAIGENGSEEKGVDGSSALASAVEAVWTQACEEVHTRIYSLNIMSTRRRKCESVWI